MNYPNRYTGGMKKKIFLRILVVFVCLTAVCALTLAYGNYLKSKADKTKDDSYSGVGRTPDTTPETGNDDTLSAFSKSVGVKSACIVFGDFEDSEAVQSYIEKLSEDGYTGITAVLIGRDGYLTYASETVAEFTKQRPAASKDNAFISEMLSKAASLSMRTSAVIFTSDDFGADSISSQIEELCVSDAAALGFDEIIAVLPSTAEGINSDTSSRILGYIGKIAEKKGDAQFGIALDESIYETPSLSPQIELFGSYVNFLAIDMSDSLSSAEDAKAFVSGITDEISGSFTVYGLRAVFDGGDAEIAEAQAKALADASFSNYMYVDAPPQPEPDSTDTDGVGGESEPGQSAPENGGDQPADTDEQTDG